MSPSNFNLITPHTCSKQIELSSPSISLRSFLKFYVVMSFLRMILLSSRSGTSVIVRFPVPKATVSGSHEPLGPGQSVELRLPEKMHIWKIKKIDGGTEQILIVKVCCC